MAQWRRALITASTSSSPSRYYVEMEYDWARVDFLLSTLDAAHPAVLTDLQAFDTFLRPVRDQTASG